MTFTQYPSGSVLCSAPHGSGSIVVLCTDMSLTLQERRQNAQEQVQKILDRLASQE